MRKAQCGTIAITKEVPGLRLRARRVDHGLSRYVRLLLSAHERGDEPQVRTQATRLLMDWPRDRPAEPRPTSAAERCRQLSGLARWRKLIDLPTINPGRDFYPGFSSVVSMGNKADLSGSDLPGHWHSDRRTDVILLCSRQFQSSRPMRSSWQLTVEPDWTTSCTAVCQRWWWRTVPCQSWWSTRGSGEVAPPPLDPDSARILVRLDGSTSGSSNRSGPSRHHRHPGW